MQNNDVKNIPTICATVIDDFMISEEEQSIILKYRNSDNQIKNVVHKILDCDDDLSNQER
jgi:hypothetical protein